MTSNVQNGEKRTVPFLAPALPSYELVGSDALFQDIKGKLLSHRHWPLAIKGLPGVGKSALCAALAHDPELLEHYSDGVLWASLGRNPDVLSLLGKWATALGVSPEDVAQRPTIPQRQRLLDAAIGQREMLLVIDDAWQSQAALNFRVGGNHCTHLLATRQPTVALEFAGSEITTVQELSAEDGLKLLKSFIPQAVEEEPETARELVTAVGGLPLAIILIGRYLQSQKQEGEPLHEALSELRDVEARLLIEQPLELIDPYSTEPKDVPLSLLAMIEMSDKALDPAARRTFYALSVLPSKPNTFSFESALAISNASPRALDTLTDYGLLENDRSGRYMLHQAMADYAQTQLTDQHPEERMIRFFSDYLATHDRDVERLDPELSNILAALNAAEEQAAQTIAMQAILLKGTNDLCHFLKVRGLYALAEEHLQRAAHLARQVSDSAGLMTSLLNLGSVTFHRGMYDDAETHLQEGLLLARDLWDRELISAFLQNLGLIASQRGEYAQAEQYYHEGLLVARLLGHHENITYLLNSLGSLAQKRGAYEQAKKYYEEGLTLARQLDEADIISALLVNLGEIATHQNNYDAANAYFQEGLTLIREIGHLWLQSAALIMWGQLHLKRAQSMAAMAAFNEALEIAEEMEWDDYSTQARDGLAQARKGMLFDKLRRRRKG